MKKLSLSLLFCSLFCTAIATHADEPYEPTVHGPYLQRIAPDSATVMWTTEKPTAAWVELWDKDQPTNRTILMDSRYGLKRTKTNAHQVEISGLKPGAVYQYKVFAGDRGKKGDPIPPSSEPADGTFRTLNPSSKTCEVFIINDIHGDSERLVNLLGQHVKPGKTDFCILNGDTVSYLSGKDQLYKVAVDPAKDFAKDVPFVFVRGNHENRGSNALDLPNVFPPNSGSEYYFLLRQGPVCFVVLDAGEDKADTRKELGGVTDFAPYLKKQEAWLKQAVRTREFTTAPYRVAIIHIPALVEEGYAEKLVRSMFVPTLAKAGVDIMISAHTHKNYFVPGGKEKDVPFPILVNDNEGAVIISANPQKMKVIHYDKDKKELRTEQFSPRK